MVNMYRLKVYKGIFCFVLIFDVAISKSCNSSDLRQLNNQCHPSQECDDKSHMCQCKPGFQPHNDTLCISMNPIVSTATPNSSSLVSTSHSSGSIVAGILIPLFLILFVIYGVYVSRKYRLVSWFRRRFHHNRNNYDEVMIGQDQDLEDDDPPLH